MSRADANPKAEENTADAVALSGDETRAAIAPLRGFRYQFFTSALAWLNLAPGESLWIEVAEDFATGTDEAAVAVQVKDRLDPISLNSPCVAKTIDSLVTLVARNPTRSIRVQLLTTGGIRQEATAGPHIPGASGIDYWREAAAGAPVAPLRDVLGRLRGLSDASRAFVAVRDDEALRRELLQRIEWIYDAPGLSALKAELVRRLASVIEEPPLRLPPADAERLLVHVVDEIFATAITVRRQLDRDALIKLLRKASRGAQAPPAPSEGAPDACVGRDDLLAAVIAGLTSGDTPSGEANIQLLHGMGGIGKTTLAAEAAWRPHVVQHFDGGRLWTSLGRSAAAPLETLNSWLRQLDPASPTHTQISDARADLATKLQSRRVLFVIDDVWPATLRAATELVVPSRGSAFLITARAVEGIDRFPTRPNPHAVGPLSAANSVALIARALQRPLTEDEVQRAQDAHFAVGGHPLALSLLAAQIETGRSWFEVLADLASESRRLEALQEPESLVLQRDDTPAAVRASLLLSVLILQPSAQARFARLGAFIRGGRFNAPAAATLWGVSTSSAAIILRGLHRLSLLDAVEGGYVLHDLVCDIAREILTAPATKVFGEDLTGQETSLGQANAELLEAYAAGRLGDGWHTLPDDGYIHDHLVQHLERTGELGSFQALLAETTHDGRCGWFVGRGGFDSVQAFATDVGRIASSTARLKGDPAGVVGLEAHCALVLASLNSVAACAPMEALLEAIDRPERFATVLSIARRLPSAEERARILTRLADAAAPDLTRAVLAEAWTAAERIQNTGSRASAMQAIIRLEAPERALALIDQLPKAHPETRISALGDLAARTPEPARSVLAEATLRVIESELPPHFQPGWLTCATPHLSPKRRAEVLARQRQQTERLPLGLDRADAMVHLALAHPPELRSSLLEDACRSAATAPVGAARFHARTIANAASLMDEQQSDEALDQAFALVAGDPDDKRRAAGWSFIEQGFLWIGTTLVDERPASRLRLLSRAPSEALAVYNERPSTPDRTPSAQSDDAAAWWAEGRSKPVGDAEHLETASLNVGRTWSWRPSGSLAKQAGPPPDEVERLVEQLRRAPASQLWEPANRLLALRASEGRRLNANDPVLGILPPVPRALLAQLGSAPLRTARERLRDRRGWDEPDARSRGDPEIIRLVNQAEDAAPYTLDDTIAKTLARARSIRPASERLRAIAWVAASRHRRMREEVVAACLPRPEETDVPTAWQLVALAKALPRAEGGPLLSAFAAARLRLPADIRCEVLCAFAQLQPEDEARERLLAEAVSAFNSEPSRPHSRSASDALVRALTPEKAVEVAERITDDRLREMLLGSIAERAPPDLARNIADRLAPEEWPRVRVLLNLARRAADPERPALLVEALTAANLHARAVLDRDRDDDAGGDEMIYRGSVHNQVHEQLVAIAIQLCVYPDLAARHLPEIPFPGARAVALACHAASAPEGLRTSALAAARTAMAAAEQAFHFNDEALAALTVSLPAHEALEWLAAFSPGPGHIGARAQAFIEVVDRLPPSDAAAVVARRLDGERPRTAALHRLLERLEDDESDVSSYETWRAFLSSSGETTRSQLARDLADLAPLALRLGGPDALVSIQASLKTVASWWP